MKRNFKSLGKSKQLVIQKYFFHIVLASLMIWSLFVAGSLYRNIERLKIGIIEIAKIEARTTLTKDITFLDWISINGNMYAPNTQNNPLGGPFTTLPEANIETSSKKKMTFINPSIMMKQINELVKERSGISSHFSSLNPIYPEDVADSWEIKALQSFVKGNTECDTLYEINGNENLRLMLPIPVSKVRFISHSDLGAKADENIYGVSVSIPMSRFSETLNKQVLNLIIVHSFFWIFTFIAIIFGSRKFKEKLNSLYDSEERFLRLSENVNDIISEINIEGEFLYLNSNIKSILGYNQEELIGRSILEFIHPEDTNLVKQEIGKDFTDIMFRMRHKNGEWMWFENKGKIFYSPEGELRSANITRDITMRKQAEQYLIIAKDHAEFANRAKNEFLSTISHEIRTPITGTLGLLWLLLNSDLDQEQKEWCELANLSTLKLLRIVEDILDFSKIDAGKLILEPKIFNIRESIVQTFKSLESLVDEKKLILDIIIDPNIPEYIFGDSARIEQIIFNLLGNAIKFTEKGKIIFTLEDEWITPEEICLHGSVSDTGIGIPIDKLDHIFKSFTQADGSTTRKYGGTGLGLAIVSKLIEMMKGKIWVESPSPALHDLSGGPGSTFHFMINLPRKN